MTPAVSIRTYLPSSSVNPYLSLLGGALRRAQVTVGELPSPLTAAWLQAHFHERGVLHYHWPSYEFSDEHRGDMQAKMEAWREALSLARRLGFAVVWTAHNIYPHDGVHHDLQQAGRTIVVQSADGLIAHCELASMEVIRHFSPSVEVSVIPHGHYVDAFGPPISRAEARKVIPVLPHSFVYLAFGLLRSYKGIEELVSSFSNSAADDSELLIAGQPWSAEFVAWLRELCLRDRRIHAMAQYIPPKMVRYLFSAADAVVLPYRSILTSGNALLASSMEKPVVAPAIGCIPELIPEGAGILYDPSQHAGLGDALQQVRHLDMHGCREASRKIVTNNDWERIAVLTRNVYQQALGRSSVDGENRQ